MAHFKEVTSCEGGRAKVTPHGDYLTMTPDNSIWKAVIMGRKTFETTGILPHRGNIVLSKSDDFDYDPERYLHVLESIDAACKATSLYEEVWVIGGAEIYSQFLEKDLISRMLITEIPTILPTDGVFFPDFRYDIPGFHTHAHQPWVPERLKFGYVGDKPPFTIHNTTIKNGLIIHDFRRLDE